MFNRYRSYDEIPAHVRGSFSLEERAYYEAAYFNHPHGLGPEWVTAHRKLEMAVDRERRDFFLSYWPDQALWLLEDFKRNHFDAEPHKYTSSIGDRLREYYPGFFKALDKRMAALSDAADTHPQLLPYWKAYETLKATYWEMLHAAEVLTRHIESPKTRKAKRHEHYKEAFAAVYPELKRLIESLVLMGS